MLSLEKFLKSSKDVSDHKVQADQDCPYGKAESKVWNKKLQETLQTPDPPIPFPQSSLPQPHHQAAFQFLHPPLQAVIPSSLNINISHVCRYVRTELKHFLPKKCYLASALCWSIYLTSSAWFTATHHRAETWDSETQDRWVLKEGLRHGIGPVGAEDQGKVHPPCCFAQVQSWQKW